MNDDSLDSPLTKEECANLSAKFQQFLYRLMVTGNASHTDGGNVVMLRTPNQPTPRPGHQQSDRDAVIYIVVVLCFYSFGIIFMMVKYMRKEEKELEEFEIYKSYLKANARDSAGYQMYQNCSRGRLANRLALQVLNTVNAIPQTNQLASKVTFV